MSAEPSELVRRFREHPGLRSKAWLRLVTQTFGATEWSHGSGDDAAVPEAGEGCLLAAGEAIYPSFV